MSDVSKVIAELIAKHLNNDLNDQEKQELEQWVQQSEEHHHFFRQLTNEETLAGIVAEYETSKGIVLNKIKEAIVFKEQNNTTTANVRWLNPGRLMAVAAAVLLILFIGGAIVWWNVDKTDQRIVEKSAVPTATPDRKPASEGAVLKLADGSEIILDDKVDGTVATQGNTRVTKQGGMLEYNGNEKPNKVLYNTLSTPKGRIYQLSLPDGSKVWLNAASSIRFPTAFTGGQRNVEITGEVYFEVRKDAAMPFQVTVNQRTTIEVLGTSFNVNAYDNEESLRTTLIEGSVWIQAWEPEQRGNSVILKPGQQAQLKNTHGVQSYSQSAAIAVVSNAPVEKVMGWKEGYFSLDDLTLAALMREVERWYDVEVVYEKGIPAKVFFGKVKRDLSLLDFMEGLKDWGVRFRLEGRKLIVTGAA